LLDEADEFLDQGWSCDWGYRASGDRCIAISVPKNGFLMASGDDWGCKRGYVKTESSSCAELSVPPMGHLDFSGHDWVCDPGYRRAGPSCVAVRVPAHGYATYESEGSGWRCERGYHRQGGGCVAIRVPAHAFLLEAGAASPGWQCDRGFHRNGDLCQPLTVPLNAHIDDSGNEWLCDPDYVQVGGRCVATVAGALSMAAVPSGVRGANAR
jgi:hypothetical protein